MARPKKVLFGDALAIILETAEEQEIRDYVVMMGIYARQRKFSFAIRIDPVAVKPVQEEMKMFKEAR